MELNGPGCSECATTHEVNNEAWRIEGARSQESKVVGLLAEHSCVMHKTHALRLEECRPKIMDDDPTNYE